MLNISRKNLLLVVVTMLCVLPIFAKAKSPFVDVIKQNRDAVVQIKVESTITNRSISPFGNDDAFKFFFPQQPQNRRYVSLGSGFIFKFNQSDNEAYILTNNHVVEKGKNGIITVTLADKKAVKAELVGLDPETDLGVIKIEVPDNETVTILNFGNSNELEIGEWAIAIGNPFGDAGLDRSVTVGVISALGRAGLNFGNTSPIYQDYIQTDAAINPGNSGGPLLDIDGNVIGINAAITSTSGGNMGIGFAIPSAIASKVAEDIVNYGHVKRAYLGIIPQEITEDLRINFDLEEVAGVLIAKVEVDTPASKAKLHEGDIIIALDGTKIYNIHKFRTEIAHSDIDKTIQITIIRDHKEMVLQAKLDSHPEYAEKDNSVPNIDVDLGIKVTDLESDFAKKFRNTIDFGVLVESILQNSQANNSSLQVGDIILKVNNQAINSVKDFDQIIENILKSDSKLKKILLRVAVRNKNNYVKYVAINITR